MTPQSRAPQALSDCALVRLRRPDGREIMLRVPAEHLDRLIELAAEQFGGVVESK